MGRDEARWGKGRGEVWCGHTYVRTYVRTNAVVFAWSRCGQARNRRRGKRTWGRGHTDSAEDGCG